MGRELFQGEMVDEDRNVDQFYFIRLQFLNKKLFYGFVFFSFFFKVYFGSLRVYKFFNNNILTFFF